MNISSVILFSWKLCIIENTKIWTFSVDMAQPETVAPSSAFKSHFKREKLTGPNFNDWHRSLRIVLRVVDKLEYLINPCLDEPATTESDEVKAVWK